MCYDHDPEKAEEEKHEYQEVAGKAIVKKFNASMKEGWRFEESDPVENWGLDGQRKVPPAVHTPKAIALAQGKPATHVPAFLTSEEDSILPFEPDSEESSGEVFHLLNHTFSKFWVETNFSV